MSAPKELELKFELPPASLKLISQLPSLRRAKVTPQHKSEISVYYDTDTQKLRKHGVMLRVRRTGESCKQTIKGTQPTRLARDEWEAEINSDAPDLRLAEGTALGPLVNRKLKRRLKPLFETRVRRTIYPLDHNGCSIEIAVDRGRIETGNAASILSEVELELETGDEAMLFELAHELIQTVPAQLVLRSKAEQGYRLIEQNVGRPAKAAPILLAPGMSARDAFRVIGFGCLKQVADNAPALASGDPEGVHQMRVGLRRLRAAISLFKELLQDPATEALKAELKWLTGELSTAREFDVLITDVLAPARKRKVRKEGLPALSREFIAKRNAALARAKAAVDSGRFRRLTLDVVVWLENGDWTKPSDDLIKKRGDVAIEEFAPTELERRWQKIKKRSKKLATLGPARRHKLRIQGKKMRYATEFFAAIFPGKRRKAFDVAMKRFQDCLGDLNDIAVHEKIISRLTGSRSRDGRKRNFAAGLLTGREDARFDPVMARAIAAYDQLVKVNTFW